jgi:hypothetical protein
MKPHDILRRRWPALAILVAATLASFPSEVARPREPAAALSPARAPEPAPVAALSPAAISATQPARSRRARATAPPSMPGRIIALDPETGELGAPSPDQLRSLRAAPGVAAVSRTEEGLTETRLTDGTVILDLDGRYQDQVIARLDRNGRLVYGCVHEDGKGHRAIRDTLPTSALEER